MRCRCLPPASCFLQPHRAVRPTSFSARLKITSCDPSLAASSQRSLLMHRRELWAFRTRINIAIFPNTPTICAKGQCHQSPSARPIACAAWPVYGNINAALSSEAARYHLTSRLSRLILGLWLTSSCLQSTVLLCNPWAPRIRSALAAQTKLSPKLRIAPWPVPLQSETQDDVPG